MSRPDRPLFLTTKGERNMDEDTLYVDDIVDRYVRIAQSRYVWDGLPDDVPEGWLETQLFWYGGVSAKDIPEYGTCLFAVAPSHVDMYGHPVRWLPTGVKGIERDTKLFKTSDNPVLWQGKSMYERIYPYLEVMKQCILTLNQNIIALSQPVLVEGLPGNDLTGKVVKLELKTGKTFLPVVDKQMTGIEVLDLKAQDHTQNLYSTFKSMHDTIMSIMGLMNGNNKTSGVNPVEQIADTQEIALAMDLGLQLRKDWCDRINDVLGTSFSVDINEAWRMDSEDIDDAGEQYVPSAGENVD